MFSSYENHSKQVFKKNFIDFILQLNLSKQKENTDDKDYSKFINKKSIDEKKLFNNKSLTATIESNKSTLESTDNVKTVENQISDEEESRVEIVTYSETVSEFLMIEDSYSQSIQHF